MPSSCSARTLWAVPGSTLRRTQTKARLFWSWATRSLRSTGASSSAPARARAVAAGLSMSWGTA